MTGAHCRSCGAARVAPPSGHSFVCESCGATNVDDEYLRARAVQVHAQAESRALRLGLASIAAGDFAAAEKQLEICVAELPSATEGWIYLAYCKAALATPLNFHRNAQAARECLQCASGLDGSGEDVRNGGILVANKLLSSALVASRYHLDMARKKLAVGEAMTGVQLVRDALRPEANDSEIRASVLAATIAGCARVNAEIGPARELENLNAQLLQMLAALAASRPELVEQAASQFPAHGGLFRNLAQKKKAALLPMQEPVARGRRGPGKFLLVGTVLALLVAGWIAYAMSGTDSQPRVATVVAAASAGQQLAAVRAPANARELLTAMLQHAESAYELSALKSSLELMPKPPSGDRDNARRLNGLGLVALRAENYAEAVERLREAAQADPADVEALNNYAYALVRAGRLAAAEDTAGVLLAQAPGRSSAWARLAEIYALTGREYEASRALLLMFQFSTNKDRALAYLRETERDATSPMRDAVRQALETIARL